MVNPTIASLSLLPVESSQATRQGRVTEIEPNGLPGWRHRDENSRKPRQREIDGQNTREERVERSCKDRGTGVCRGLLSSLQLSTDQCIHVKKLPKGKDHWQKQNHSLSWHRTRKNSDFHQPEYKSLIIYGTSGKVLRRVLLNNGEKSVTD